MSLSACRNYSPKQLAAKLAEMNPGKQFYFSDSAVGYADNTTKIMPLYAMLINNLGWGDYPHVLGNGVPLEEKWEPLTHVDYLLSLKELEA